MGSLTSVQAPSAPARSPQALSGVDMAHYPAASNISRSSSSASGMSEPFAAEGTVAASPAVPVRGPSGLSIAAAGA